MLKINRPLRGTAALAAVLATASCTADTASEARPSAAAPAAAARALPQNWTCQAGRFHWGTVTRRDTLVAVSDPQEVHIPEGKTAASTFDLVPVRTLRSVVTPSFPKDALDPQSAVDSLAEKTGLDLAKAGTTFALSAADKSVTTSSGKFDGVLVAVVGVDVVEAPFVHGCDTKGRGAVRGTLTTWSLATSSSLFKCGIDEKLPAVETEAEALVCGERNGV
ncbi:hypothetical protein PV396_44065 [Streptomyces sp. ME02-8801-2C]|uniref:hypothetical protein n=1 Tax=Streptomyces sp. ME02-8801-2C TaxID=3028680 RepID=UPI0029AA283E|nr:hypothetical protein [Streptomyces sp. ME02-8801-2C]MDX3458822.1 hypothetical protein [Streptomyces sp. ME02-8801-2C]